MERRNYFWNHISTPLRDRERNIIGIEKEELEKRENEVRKLYNFKINVTTQYIGISIHLYFDLSLVPSDMCYAMLQLLS